MAALAFDTLNASDTLRQAGVDEATAKAIVEVVKRTTDLPDTAHLATREDLASLELCLSEKIRVQGWALLGGMTALIAAAVAVLKLIP